MNETDICIRALRIQSADERAQFLDGACLGDDELRRQVDEQLGEFQQASLGPESLRPMPAAAQLIVEAMPLAKGADTPDGPVTELNKLDEDDGEVHEPVPESLEYYRIQKILGRGGMGTVYLADDTRLGRPVALKTLKRRLAADRVAKDRFLREARSAARLDHDHIISIYYVGEANGIPFLAMPFLKGETLDARLRREGADDPDAAVQFGQASGQAPPLPNGEAIRIARQVALGLSAAHAQGLIHRDIKPANIWLEAPAGRVKILDFGLARSQKEDKNLTASGAIMGTPAYMAPEQARGKPVDGRADIFSLGCVLYEMMTGACPFTGPDTMAILTSLALDDPTPPKEVNRHCPQALSELIMSMLAKKLDLRPASAELVAARLATFDAQGSDTLVSTHRVVTGESLAIPTGSSRGPRAGTRRRGIGLVAVGLVMISGVFGLVFQGAIYRTATNRGELLVDVDDAGVSVEILHDGAVVGERSTRRDFTLPAGKGEIEFIDVDGRPLLRRPFALGRNGTATVRMTSEELSDARKSLNFDKIDPGEAAAARRAAERILSVGGVVGITDANRQFREVADLPLLPDPFRLVGVSLHDNHLVSDNDLEALKDCRNLIYLDLVATNIGDAGLANLKDCKELADLRLGITGVGDAGLANFKGCQKLRVLDLNGTRATDAGLANFRDCPNLTDLALGIPGITDVGAGYFAGRTGIALLNLAGTDITDAGFAFFKDCTNITVLHLENTRLSDASLAYFQNCQGLTRATFQGTQITDDGLAHLKNCKKLRQLSLQDTKVTATGVEELGKALPQCRIEWDGRVIEPRSADK